MRPWVDANADKLRSRKPKRLVKLLSKVKGVLLGLEGLLFGVVVFNVFVVR